MSSWMRGAVSNDFVPRNRIITSSARPLVSVVLRSGLGNRLFQILAGLGYAERTGKQFVFFEKQMLENYHTGPKLTKDILLAIFPQIKVYRSHIDWNHYHEDALEFYDDKIIPTMDGSVLLHGFFQNYSHFPISYRKLFKIPKPEFCKFDTSLITWTNTYFIHYRKGDYVDSDYDVVNYGYYKKAVEQIMELSKGLAKFLIFSDQPDKINYLDNLINCGLLEDSFTIIPSSVNVWESLYLMSQCAGAICANSTFSWFGAYAQQRDGPVFMPSIWKKGFVKNPVPEWAIQIKEDC
jgi:hypothetical protein